MMLERVEALAIAEQAIQGKMNEQRGAPVTIQLGEGRYIVTFGRVNPPGVRGPDYNVRVTIDAESGEVLELLVAS